MVWNMPCPLTRSINFIADLIANTVKSRMLLCIISLHSECRLFALHIQMPIPKLLFRELILAILDSIYIQSQARLQHCDAGCVADLVAIFEIVSSVALERCWRRAVEEMDDISPHPQAHKSRIPK